VECFERLRSTTILANLANTKCSQILTYGIEAVAVSKSDLKSLTFAQNAIYVKVFCSFDKKTLNYC